MPALGKEREEHRISVGKPLGFRKLQLGAGHLARRRFAFLNCAFAAVEDLYRGEVADLFFFPIIPIGRVPYFESTFVRPELESCLTVDRFDRGHLVPSADSGRPMVDRVVVCQSVRSSDEKEERDCIAEQDPVHSFASLFENGRDAYVKSATEMSRTNARPARTYQMATRVPALEGFAKQVEELVLVFSTQC